MKASTNVMTMNAGYIRKIRLRRYAATRRVRIQLPVTRYPLIRKNASTERVPSDRFAGVSRCNGSPIGGRVVRGHAWDMRTKDANRKRRKSKLFFRFI